MDDSPSPVPSSEDGKVLVVCPGCGQPRLEVHLTQLGCVWCFPDEEMDLGDLDLPGPWERKN